MPVDNSKDGKMQTTTPDGDRSGQNDQTQPDAQPALPREVQGQIGKQLRQVYGQMLAEPLPDKFGKLLAELAKTETKQ
ncbi:MAG: NepR family anti-sigma factor [Hyphomicrobium sp.]